MKQIIVSFLLVALSFPIFAETSIPASTSTAQETFTLTVHATQGSQVRILNPDVKENGFILKPNTYEVLITYDNSEFKKQVDIIDEDVTLYVSFIEVTPELRRSNSCKNMKNCAQAYYQFEQRGDRGLDRDDDGIPCENICKKLENFVFINEPTTEK